MRPAIVLIPGNMCDARLWDGANGLLRAELGRYGVSLRDADTCSDDSIAGIAARILAAGDEPMLPISFSMGAIVALEMMRQAPERIVGAAMFGLNAGADLPERSVARIRQQAEVSEGGLERVLVEELKPNYLAQCNRGNAALLTLLRDMGMLLGPNVFIAQSEALRLRTDLRSELAKVRVPVLLGCGEEDQLCPPAWHDTWEEQLRHVQKMVFANAGHMLPLESPTCFAQTIIRWIEEEELLG